MRLIFPTIAAGAALLASFPLAGLAQQVPAKGPYQLLKTMKVTATYGLNGKGGGAAGLGLDVKNHVLFVACRDPQAMVMLDANTGKYLADLPIGRGCDSAGFNPKTQEAFSSQGDGTLTVIKETSPTTFVVEQTVTTMPGARTSTLDARTGHILLIGAEYEAPAAPAPTAAAAPATPAAPIVGGQGWRGGRGRRRMVPGSFSIIVVGKSPLPPLSS